MRLRSKLSRAFATVILSWAVVGTSICLGKDAKVIRLDDSSTASVTISGRGTVLSFPTKPNRVILGKADSFGIEYCDNDLAISPLSTSATSHLYVYLYGRRFSFSLRTSMNDSGAVILVRDAKEITHKARRYE